MKLCNPLNNQRGAILIFLLLAVTLLGLMAGIAGSSWQTIVQRAKEQELLWRGNQIRMAISSYYRTAQAGSKAAYPRSFEHLLKDPRFAGKKKHLRRQYRDPFTDEDFFLIKNQGGLITGVRSKSKLEPFKKDNFSSENEKFAGKLKYAEWEFIYTPDKKKKNPSQTTKSGNSVQPARGSGTPSWQVPTN